MDLDDLIQNDVMLYLLEGGSRGYYANKDISINRNTYLDLVRGLDALVTILTISSISDIIDILHFLIYYKFQIDWEYLSKQL